MERLAMATKKSNQPQSPTPIAPSKRTSKSALTNRSKNQQPKIPSTTTPIKSSNPSHSPNKKVTQSKSYKNIKYYHPFQKQNKLIDRKVKASYEQMQYQHLHRLQNRHSIFLNARNPQIPIYLRAQHILDERELVLQEKRQEMQRLKAEREYEEQQRYLAELPPKKVITKEQAQKLSERLYKQHYAKLSRLNHQRMQRLKQETKVFRDKPQISEASKQLFNALKDKAHLQNAVFNRFQKYNLQKTKKQAEINKIHQDKYFPFKPIINQTSKLLTEAKPDREKLSRSKHCDSCIRLRNSKNNLNLSYSPLIPPKSQAKQSPLKISQFCVK